MHGESLIICDVYKVKNDDIISVEKWGKLNPDEIQSMSHGQALITLQDKPDEVYLKLFQVPSLSISFTFMHYPDVVETTRDAVLRNGLFFGILAFLFLYNFVLCLYTKFTPYVPYLLYVLGLIGYFLVTDTFYLQSIGLHVAVNMMVWFHLSMILSLVGMFGLPIVLLNLFEYYPRYARTIVVLTGLIILLESVQIAAVLMQSHSFYSILFDLETLMILLSASSLLVVSYMLALKGDKIALYYSLAWSVLFLALINYVIQNNFFESDKELVKAYFRLAIVIEGLLFSFILAFRIRQLQKLEAVHHQILVQERQNKEVSTMLNEVAHQWRQPLNTIHAIIFENTLKETVPNKSEWKQTLGEIEEMTTFLSTTIDDFQQNYLLSDESEDFTLEDVCKQALYFLSRRLREKSVTYTLDLESMKPIQGSSRYFTQVLLIVLNNAIEAFQEKQKEKHILISSCQGETEIMITIEDNAGGMDVSMLKQVFSSKVSGKEGHQGMGLILAKKIIEKSFHGELILENSNNGLQCTIKVPHG